MFGGIDLGDSANAGALRLPHRKSKPLTVKRIGEALMTDYVWPLQCVGLLLTAALIGALDSRHGGETLMHDTATLFLMISAALFSHWFARGAESASRDFHSDRHRDDARRRESQLRRFLAFWLRNRSADRRDGRDFLHRHRRCGSSRRSCAGHRGVSPLSNDQRQQIDQLKG